MQLERYVDFTARVYNNANPRRVPVNGTIEISHRCPLTCFHCYNNLPMNDQGARSLEMTFEEHCALIDEIAEAGCLFLLFTGGGGFAPPRFLALYHPPQKRGVILTPFPHRIPVCQRVGR